MLADLGHAHGLRLIVLRYFNAAGADPDGDIGEAHDPEPHLIPRVPIRSALEVQIADA
jgi:UDP-glucose 4-epimerase